MKKLNKTHNFKNIVLCVFLLLISYGFAIADEKKPFDPQRLAEKSLQEMNKEKAVEAKGEDKKPIQTPPLPQQPKAQQKEQQKEVKKPQPTPDFLKREIFPQDADTGVQDLKNYKPRTQVIQDEGFHAVEISLRDVSRLVCFTDIEKVIYSKEKGIEIKTSGRNAYIKNLPKESVNPLTGKLMIEYDSRAKELYVICGEKTFSLVLIPQDIPAVTAYLQSYHSDATKALQHEKSNTYEDTILELIKSAYLEEVPRGYEVNEINKPVKEFQEVQIIHIKEYIGGMYQIHEYVVKAKVELTLNEATILDTLKPNNTLAVSIVHLYLRPNEQTRVFIVSRR